MPITTGNKRSKGLHAALHTVYNENYIVYRLIYISGLILQAIPSLQKYDLRCDNDILKKTANPVYFPMVHHFKCTLNTIPALGYLHSVSSATPLI